MYYVVQVKDPLKRNARGTVVGKAATLLGAKALRMVSSDMVFRRDGSIEPSTEWLWDSEKRDEQSCSRRCIARKLFFDRGFGGL